MATVAVNAQDAPKSNALTFDGDTAILTVAIKPDKTADFEQIMKDVSAALMKSEKPERKQQAAGWKVVKSATPMKDGNVVYMHLINPVVEGRRLHGPRDPVRSESRPRGAAGDLREVPRFIRGEPWRWRVHDRRRPLEVTVDRRRRRTPPRRSGSDSASRTAF